jgi:putative pyruvate formate lyase activating enzyme
MALSRHRAAVHSHGARRGEAEPLRGRPGSGTIFVVAPLGAAVACVAVNQAAVREMHRQVGDRVLDADGIAQHGLLVRHLVLPGDAAGSTQVLGFIAREISRASHVNPMDQYPPCCRADQYPPLNRPLRYDELEDAVRLAQHYGRWRLDHLQSRRARRL